MHLRSCEWAFQLQPRWFLDGYAACAVIDELAREFGLKQSKPFPPGYQDYKSKKRMQMSFYLFSR